MLLPDFVTPKQVARAIGVSESSIKRWCDQGLLEFSRTAGGHRRLSLPRVLDFLRERQFALVDPAVLGLPAVCGQGERTDDRCRDLLLEALLAPDDARSRQVLFDLYLSGHSTRQICQDVVTPVLHEIGRRWSCGDVEIYQERRACEATIRHLHELRLAVGAPSEKSPVAIGGSGPEDIYSVPTTMVELVLRSGGWDASSLGSGLTFDTLTQALEHVRPRLFWLSVTHLGSPEEFVRGFRQLWNAAKKHNVALLAGGQALTETLRSQLQCTAFCHTLDQLESAANMLNPIPALQQPA